MVGTNSMKEMLNSVGINTDSNDPEYVVLGYDTELNYEKLKKASIFMQNGVDLISKLIVM